MIDGSSTRATRDTPPSAGRQRRFSFGHRHDRRAAGFLPLLARSRSVPVSCQGWARRKQQGERGQAAPGCWLVAPVDRMDG